MTESSHPQPPPASDAQRPAAPAASGPAWPTVIGVLSIVLAAQELLVRLVELAALCFKMGDGLGLRHESVKVGAQLLVVHAAVSALLLVAGIGLLRRSRLALLHRPYAITRLAWQFFVLWVFVRPVPGVEGWDRVRALLWDLLAVLPGMICPVFLLAWFSRPKIRQQMAAWRARN